MWTVFWLNNIHFVFELFAGLVCFMITWLSFSNYLFDRQPKMIFRSSGFFLVALYKLTQGASISDESIILLSLIFYLLGLILILISFSLEIPLKIPTLPLVLVLPSIFTLTFWFYSAATVILGLTFLLALKRYKKDGDLSIRYFCFAFGFLTLASFLSLYTQETPFKLLWILENLLKITGFIFLAFWSWQYLKLRLKEELLLVFVTLGLLIGIIVTFSFSALFLKQMEQQTKNHLAADVKVLDYAVEKMERESLANATLLSKNESLISAVKNNDFGTLEELVTRAMKDAKTNFLTVADNKGEVILRAHTTTARGDNISKEIVGGLALKGNLASSVEPTETEKFSIRGAAPLYSGKNLIGVVITGFIIDNNLVDRIKKITGLEVTVYEKEVRIATTHLSPDGKSRSIGTKNTDLKVNKIVLEKGEGFVGRTNILGRPYLASLLPISNADGTISGMLQVANPQMEVLKTVTATNQLTLLISIIITLITILPAYLLAKNISRQVKI